MGTFEEPKGGPLDIGEEYWEITILGRERYWDTGENIHSWENQEGNHECVNAQPSLFLILMC